MSLWIEILLLLLCLSLLLGALPLVLLRRYDLHDPEPFPILIGSALIGGFVAGGVALAVFHLLALAGIPVRPASLHSFLIIGPVEELAKLAGFYAAYRWFREYFDEPVDYAIYMGAVAIGFACLENAAYAAGVAGTAPLSATSMDVTWMLGVRLLVTTPAHVIWSIFVGLGIAHMQRDRAGVGPLVRGLLLAALLHGLWDFAAFRAWPYLLLHGFFIWLFFRGRFILAYLLADSPVRPRLVADLAAALTEPAQAREAASSCPVCGGPAQRRDTLRLRAGMVERCVDCGMYLATRRTLENLFHYYGSMMRGLFLRWRRAPDSREHRCPGRVDTLIDGNACCRATGLAWFEPGALEAVFERINADIVARYRRLWLRV